MAQNVNKNALHYNWIYNYGIFFLLSLIDTAQSIIVSFFYFFETARHVTYRCSVPH